MENKKNAETTAKQAKEVAQAATKTDVQAKPAQEIADIAKEIEQKQKELNKVLKVLETKKALAHRREIFLKTLNDIDNFMQQMEESDAFDTTDGCLRVYNTCRPYNTDNAIISITHTKILKEIIVFISEKIQTTVQEIERELVA